ncbi:MAG: TonB-dependent receptor, partial [Desulfobacterales bacterium]
MRRSCISLLTVLLGMGLVFGGFSTTFAQDEPKAEFTLDEIVVTAERRETNAQDTPISVSAWDAVAIDEQAINGIVDLQMRMPSTTFTADRISIRGVGREMNQLGTDPGVGLFFDGFYDSENGGLADLFDVERIESIRGPQSTLYGKATLGGAINILYVRPTSEWSGQVKARIGNYGDIALYEAFGGPLVGDTLLGRIVATSREYDGHQKNVVYDEYQGDSSTFSFAVKLLYQPTDRFSMYLKYGKSQYDGHPAQGFQRDPYNTDDENFWFMDLYAASIYAPGSFYKNPTYDDPTDSIAAVVNPSINDPWKINTNTVPVRWLDSNQIDLTTTLDLGDITVKHLTFYRDWDYYSLIDWDYGPVPDTSREGEVLMDVYEWSQELQVIYGGEDSPISFIGGLYYYQEHRNQDFNLYYLGDGYFELLYPWDGTNIYTGYPFDPFPPLPGGANYYTPQANRTIYWYTSGIDDTSKSVYGQLDYQLTDTLNLSAGARYAIDEKKGHDKRFYQWFPDIVPSGLPNDNFAINTATGEFYYHSFPMALWNGYPFDANTTPPFSRPGHTGDWDAFLYKVGADYKPSDATLFYVTISRGYKPGGFVLGTMQGATFDAEYIDAYEGGWKQTWLDERFRTNATVYFYDYQDKQVADREGNETKVENAASAESYGFEFEGTGYLVENLLVALTYSYLHTEYTSFLTTDQAELLKGNQQLSGNPLASSPEHKLAVSGTYTIPTDIGDFSLYAIYFWQDDAYFRPFATFRSHVDSWDRVDTRLAWNSTDYKWRATLYIKNLFDEIGTFSSIVGGPYENF